MGSNCFGATYAFFFHSDDLINILCESRGLIITLDSHLNTMMQDGCVLLLFSSTEIFSRSDLLDIDVV